jgi:valyl-tRNA synthetase
MADETTRHELSARFDPTGTEAPIYARWMERGGFHVDAAEAAEPYVIAIPPPNVTAALHMGHGLNNTIQDVLIRFQRMRGRDAMWIPGTDHAGIATQNVVERDLAKEGLTRHDLGRERFVERVWEWVDRYGSTIIDQLKVMGCSCDWERTRFTLDEGLSQAVREVFVRLYEKGLIYRGNYIINWCPRCLTALSNEEAEHHESQGRLYHIRYPLADAEGEYVVVATTRPETMLGDTAVAVHPEDERNRHLVGRIVDLPLVGRRIPVIADEFVDPEFGSGFVKVTPAHDPNDFEIGSRHDLPRVDIMNDDATISEEAPEAYRGLDRFEARKRVLEDLEALGLVLEVEEHEHSVGQCYRCGTVVEPRLSLQWFVRMKPLAVPALEAYRDGRLRFHPERFGNTYEHWMTNVRDWCISRQLWWGHRIPVWYCRECDEIIVARDDPDECGACGGMVEQDPDVLDTWFSSWLWPFSTLGWPEDTPDLESFYPTHTLSTAPEILFFWVARMVMAGLEFAGAVPFTDVLLHGTVRDAQGRRMSKSLGNGIDPLEVVDRFGADAMRFTLVNSAALGTDLQLDHEDLDASFRVGRNFANKMWNAVRFGLGYLTEDDVRAVPTDFRLELTDRWILARYSATAAAVTDALERFRLHDAAELTYQFVWGEFCDWYLELVKIRLRGDRGEESRAAAGATLAFVLDGWLRLLHPIMPFITEEMYCHLPGRTDEDSLLHGPWTAADRDQLSAADAESAVSGLQEVVVAVRNLRSDYGIDPSRRIGVIVARAPAEVAAVVADELDGLLRLGGMSSLEMVDSIPTGEPGAHAVLRSGAEVFLPLSGIVDIDKERDRIQSEIERLEGLLSGSRRRLEDSRFVDQAPPEVVEREQEKKRSFEERLSLLVEKRASFGSE